MPVSQVSFGGLEIPDGHTLLSNWYRFRIKMVHLLQVNRKLLNENVQLPKAPARRLGHPLSGRCIRTLREWPQIDNEPGRFFLKMDLLHPPTFIVLNVFYFQIASE